MTYWLCRIWHRFEEAKNIKRLLGQHDLERIIGAEDTRQFRIRNQHFMKRWELTA